MFSLKNIALALGSVAAISTANAAIFVVAHPDDDVLFMARNLGTDIIGNYPTVIIMVTAGDAANGELPKAQADSYPYYNNMGLPYYRVRLNARQNGLDTWVRSNYPRPWVLSEVNFGPTLPRVEKAVLGNVIEYRINLPDSAAPNDASSRTYLQKMFDDPTFKVKDVRQFNTYTGPILRTVIRQIAKLHFATEPTLVINYQNPVADGADHPDHTAVGKHVQLALNEKPVFKCMWQSIYDGYAIRAYDENQSAFKDRQRLAYEAIHL